MSARGWLAAFALALVWWMPMVLAVLALVLAGPPSQAVAPTVVYPCPDLAPGPPGLTLLADLR